MKKIFGLMLFTAMLWLLSCQLFAATITAEDLRGDGTWHDCLWKQEQQQNNY